MSTQLGSENFPVIRCIGIGKTYSGATEAVQNVDLTVNHGEILVLLGPSGCGKTTLLRMIAGFEEPTRGSLSIGGQLVSIPGKFVKPERRKVGMVFQDYALFPHISVGKNIQFGVDTSNNPDEHVQKIIDLVGLNHLLHRKPNELSGGEQQRTALARALAPRPTVMLFDEPLSNLDATLRVSIRAEIKEILKQAEVTTIFVTHDKEEAMFLADRIAIMHDGEIEQIDTPEQIYNKPATRFVAEFMDPASFLNVSIEDQHTLATEIGNIHITEPIDPTEKLLQLLIRGNNVFLSPEPGTAIIDAVSFKGSHYSYAIKLASGQTIEYLSSDNVLKVGQVVSLRINDALPIHLYENGKHKYTTAVST